MAYTFDHSAFLGETGRFEAKNPRLTPRLRQPRAVDCSFANPRFGRTTMALFPEGSFFLSLDFELITQYSSTDDGPPDNTHPVVTEWVYRVPMVRPTTWKGNLRFAARQDSSATAADILHLFGNEKEPVDGVEGSFQEGRLHFYPTFFGSASLDKAVINPHDRRTRKGKDPVTFRTVGGAGNQVKGRFSLLYLAEPDPATGFDWKTVARHCCDWTASMLAMHGFGAKKLKGWGLCSDDASEVRMITSELNVVRQKCALSHLADELLRDGA